MDKNKLHKVVGLTSHSSNIATRVTSFLPWLEMFGLKGTDGVNYGTNDGCMKHPNLPLLAYATPGNPIKSPWIDPTYLSGMKSWTDTCQRPIFFTIN